MTEISKLKFGELVYLDPNCSDLRVITKEEAEKLYAGEPPWFVVTETKDNLPTRLERVSTQHFETAPATRQVKEGQTAAARPRCRPYSSA